MLSEELASLFARAVLAADERSPDMHWVLLRALHRYPMLAENGRIVAVLDAELTAAFKPPCEKPDEAAWLLELQAEALRMKTRWSRTLAPLAQRLWSRVADFGPRPDGAALACIFALDYARASGELPLEMEIRKAARRWYGRDRDAPLIDESLVAAVLMKQILDPGEFTHWLSGFLPSGVGPLAEPPAATKLCLSRAWCFGALGLPELAEKHLAVGVPRAGGADYASFAVLALSAAALKSP